MAKKRRDSTTVEPWTAEERAVLDSLASPWRIQEFLNRVDYSTDAFYRSPRSVLRDRRAHCVDGALMAAAALRRLGFDPMIAEMTAVRDDDHLMALYRVNGLWGAVAKSNTTVLRFREPVFRTLRELVMSYFEFYFNTAGEKTLRAYSQPLRLTRFDPREWMTSDDAVEGIIEELEATRHVSVVSEAMAAELNPVDKQVLEAGFLGANPDGLFDPSEGPAGASSCEDASRR